MRLLGALFKKRAEPERQPTPREIALSIVGPPPSARHGSERQAPSEERAARQDYNARLKSILAHGGTAVSLIPCNSVYRGYDADDVPPFGQSRVGEHPHQADAAPPVDQAEAAPGDRGADSSCGVGVGRANPRRRAAEDAEERAFGHLAGQPRALSSLASDVAASTIP